MRLNNKAQLGIKPRTVFLLWRKPSDPNVAVCPLSAVSPPILKIRARGWRDFHCLNVKNYNCQEMARDFPWGVCEHSEPRRQSNEWHIYHLTSQIERGLRAAQRLENREFRGFAGSCLHQYLINAEVSSQKTLQFLYVLIT